MINYKFNKLPS